jgi:hypothetical protein
MVQESENNDIDKKSTNHIEAIDYMDDRKSKQ